MPILWAMSMTLSLAHAGGEPHERAVHRPRGRVRNGIVPPPPSALRGEVLRAETLAPSTATSRHGVVGRVAVGERGGERDDLPGGARPGVRSGGSRCCTGCRSKSGPPTIAFTAPVAGSIDTSEAVQSGPFCGHGVVDRRPAPSPWSAGVERRVDLQPARQQRRRWRSSGVAPEAAGRRAGGPAPRLRGSSSAGARRAARPREGLGLRGVGLLLGDVALLDHRARARRRGRRARSG